MYLKVIEENIFYVVPKKLLGLSTALNRQLRFLEANVVGAFDVVDLHIASKNHQINTFQQALFIGTVSLGV
eukprot:1272345-Prymnesium_polylepis.1